MKYFFSNIKNIFDFYLRQKIKFSRRNYYVENEPKEGMFKTPEKISQEQFLYEKYNLDFLKNNSTQENYSANLYMLDVLDKNIQTEFKPEISVLDIGAKNWFYVKGEYFFFKKFTEKLSLDGIELDSHRLYWNFYSRAEVAKFYISGLDSANYISGDLLEHNKKYDFILWFLPFVKKYPLIKWGLPLGYFKPLEMLKHAYGLLNEGGQMMIVNQEKEEFLEQQWLCEQAEICFEPLGEIKSVFSKYELKRYALLIKK